jgi:hypothetical protein
MEREQAGASASLVDTREVKNIKLKSKIQIKMV